MSDWLLVANGPKYFISVRKRDVYAVGERVDRMDDGSEVRAIYVFVKCSNDDGAYLVTNPELLALGLHGIEEETSAANGEE